MRSRSKLLSWLKLLAFIIPLTAGLIYLVWFSPVFVIQKIVVNGVQLTDEEISDLLGQKIIGSNILFWQPDGKQLIAPRFFNLRVDKNYFARTIEINVKERNKNLIWCFESSDACYWVDETGYIFSAAPSSSGGLITAISDRRDPPLNIGNYVLSSEMNSNLRGILGVLSRLDMPLDYIRVENIKLREIIVKPVNGPRIVFSLSIDPDFTEAAINSLLKSSSWKNIKSLNLTVYGRAYPSF